MYLHRSPWRENVLDPCTSAVSTPAFNPLKCSLRLLLESLFKIHAFYTCLCVRKCVCVCVCVCVFVFVYVIVIECVCLSMWVSECVMMSHVDKAWICSAEEFLELYGNVEAVVRNCLLRWSGHLFEVPSTNLFNQCFCFKDISLFFAPIGAFFHW